MEWFERQLDLDPERLVFIDETWASTKMARTCGRAPRGERLRAAIPHAHWKTTTFVAGLRSTGMIATLVLDGPINGIAFQAYVEQVLVPELNRGDVVVMDNLSSHKGTTVRTAIEAAGASLLYSRPTVPTSIRSRTPSPSSRPGCGMPPSAPSAACGTPSPSRPPPSAHRNAPTTSPLPATTAMQPDRKVL